MANDNTDSCADVNGQQMDGSSNPINASGSTFKFEADELTDNNNLTDGLAANVALLTTIAPAANATQSESGKFKWDKV